MNLLDFFKGGSGAKISAKEFAGQVGVKPSVVSNWVRGKKQVPAERCPRIERVTNGEVTCEELRPDVEWHVVRTGTALSLQPGQRLGAAADSIVVLAGPAPANDADSFNPEPEAA